MADIRRLVTVIIDDRYEHRSEQAPIAHIRESSDVYIVTGLRSALEQLQAFSYDQQIDIILCDVNMELDKSQSHFEIGSDKIRAAFGVTGMLQDSSFKPYGPILALPFAKYFLNGGIILPISAYWNSASMLTNDMFNGYVYVAMALIWGMGEPKQGQEFKLDHFERNLQPIVEQARDSEIPNIEHQFYQGICLRRRQLFDSAMSLSNLPRFTFPKLRNLTTPEDVDAVVSEIERSLAGKADGSNAAHDCMPNDQIQSLGTVDILSLSQQSDRVSRRSLYGDVHNDLFEIRKRYLLAEKIDYLEIVIRKLSYEERYLQKEFNRRAILEFCLRFIKEFHNWYEKLALDGIAKLPERKAKFEEIYWLCYSNMELDKYPDRNIPRVSSWSDTPPYLRRYLLLLSQLYIHLRGAHTRTEPHIRSGKPIPYTNISTPVRSCLGLDTGHDRILLGFVGWRRKTRSPEFEIWLKPFVKPTETDQNWDRFNILRRGLSHHHFDWTPLDREFAAKAWPNFLDWSQESPGALPFGLE